MLAYGIKKDYNDWEENINNGVARRPSVQAKVRKLVRRRERRTVKNFIRSNRFEKE